MIDLDDHYYKDANRDLIVNYDVCPDKFQATAEVS